MRKILILASLLMMISSNIVFGEESYMRQNTPVYKGHVNKLKVPLDASIQVFIERQAKDYCLPKELIYAIIETESNFKADVISKTDDYGLMQINKINHQWLEDTLGVTNLLNPYQNIMAGVYILNEQYNKSNGDLHRSLMAYNYGYGQASKYWKKGIFESSYSRKVIQRYETYERTEKHSIGQPQIDLLVY